MKYHKYYDDKNIDYGPNPYVVNISYETENNSFYRKVIWTGKNMQLTLMSIPPGGEIGLEIHPQNDQFLRIEMGKGKVMMGNCKERMDIVRCVGKEDAILIPAGTWHNLINTGRLPLRLYSIYSPPHHSHGVINMTKEEAEEKE